MDPQSVNTRGCTAEQRAVLEVLRAANGKPLTLNQIATGARAKLPPNLWPRVAGEAEVVCILATLRLRPGFRTALRKHGSPKRLERAAAPNAAPPNSPRIHWARPLTIAAAATTLGGCAALAPSPVSHPVMAVATYFPGGVVAKRDVPIAFTPFVASVVSTCRPETNCAGPELEVDTGPRTPIAATNAYHSEYGRHFAQVSPGMRQWLAQAPQIDSAPDVGTNARQPALRLAAGVGEAAAPLGPGLRMALAMPEFAKNTPPIGTKLTPGVEEFTGQRLVEQLGRIDPTQPELHARPGPTMQAAAIQAAHPRARVPQGLAEVNTGHLVIAFDSGSQRVNPAMRQALRELVSSLPVSERIELRGRVGFRNPGAVGQALAMNRAKAIEAELTSLGIDGARIRIATPLAGDLLDKAFDSPLNRSVSLLLPQSRQFAGRAGSSPG
jgi:hypothetical protein